MMSGEVGVAVAAAPLATRTHSCPGVADGGGLTSALAACVGHRGGVLSPPLLLASLRLGHERYRRSYRGQEGIRRLLVWYGRSLCLLGRWTVILVLGLILLRVWLLVSVHIGVAGIGLVHSSISLA